MGKKSKYIMVSGGAGFVGSNLCGRLLKDGHRVVCIDNLYTGSLNNIQEFLSNEDFEFRQMDILDNAEVEKLKSLSIEEIYHLACPASPVHYQKDAFIRPAFAWRVPSICWSWLSTSVARCSFPLQAKSMAIHWFILKRRITMAM